MAPPYCFWYVFATNGADGFLLDLVRRPNESLARLVTYQQGRPPKIVRHGFQPEAVNGVPGSLGITLGGIALDAMGCRSHLPGMDLNARFALNGRSMRFVPRFLPWLFDTVPDFQSQYGAIEQAVCEGAEYRDAPVTCSTYSLESIAKARWLLISSPKFAGTDLAFEISAARLLGRWMPTAWVYYNGREYRFNSALDSILHVRVHRAGEVDSGERVFTVSIRGKGLPIEIDARGPIDQFARLETEGSTDIHTTLFGTCSAIVAGQKFMAERTCLLEVKN